MTLVAIVPGLHNMFMVLLIFAQDSFQIGLMKPIFLVSVSSRGGMGGGSSVCGHGSLSLYSSYIKFK